MKRLTEAQINAVRGMVVQGYTIERTRVKSGIYSDSDHYGIAYAKDKADHFVTWEFKYVSDTPEFYWGHYHMDNQTKALEDYRNRD